MKWCKICQRFTENDDCGTFGQPHEKSNEEVLARGRESLKWSEKTQPATVPVKYDTTSGKWVEVQK